ncbi:PREDICTED: polyglutamine-binding protein 1 [Nicrophorus vespilloides]|uniref:Polyglutamine-binding protein 1 n=1 Tax=Nicrophorus vespilloides TaxID=110193 RepID=A0ABM1NDF3_NICVS|nr:PREDICTED: polyglutamine-binding protein 1 [Nicrophorus vespilloides]
MPLPAALAAKLAKRGLVGQQKPTVVVEKENKPESKCALCCPNKYNIYHECTTWCQIHWKVHNNPEPHYMKSVKKMLEKYPLPKNCTELFDNGVGRYYYWDIEKNLVSWLPPTHPKAVLTEPAAILRARLKEMSEQEQIQRDFEKRTRERHKERKDKEDERRYNKHDDRDRGRRRSKREDLLLDPMDPASYSDIPRGSWSDGLEINKLKADSTAPGALFQQRPYPSPGDVLEANKSSNKKK